MTRLVSSFALLCGVMACAQHTPSPSNPPPPASSTQRSEPFKSTVPCAEQCGGDARCNANCTPITNQWPPAGTRP